MMKFFPANAPAFNSEKNRDSILSRAKGRFRRAAPKFLVPELGALFFVGCWFRINGIRPRSRSRMRVLRDYMGWHYCSSEKRGQTSGSRQSTFSLGNVEKNRKVGRIGTPLFTFASYSSSFRRAVQREMKTKVIQGEVSLCLFHHEGNWTSKWGVVKQEEVKWWWWIIQERTVRCCILLCLTHWTKALFRWKAVLQRWKGCRIRKCFKRFT